MTYVRPLQVSDIEPLVDRCWMPFRREMAAIDEYNELVGDGLREEGVAYRRRVHRAYNRETFVAVDGDTLVGYVSVGTMDAPPGLARGNDGLIYELYVQPSQRGQGIATALRSRAEEWAREHDCTHLSLFVHPENEPARTIYRRWGFDAKRELLVQPLDG